MEANGIFLQMNKITILAVMFFSIKLLVACGENNVESNLELSIESINERGVDLVNRKVVTQGVILIHPDLRLFQDESVKNVFGETFSSLSIPIDEDFNYDEIKNLECFGKNVIVEGYVIEDAEISTLFLGKGVRLINADGSVCHYFN